MRNARAEGIRPLPAQPVRPSVADRMLDAAQRLVMQTGARRLSLTEVATRAGVSRPTLYRYFTSKEELIEALGKREYRRFNTAMAAAVANATGVQRLEVAIDVAAGFLQDQPPRDLVDLDPGFVNDEMARVLPMMTGALAEVLMLGVEENVIPCGADPADLAAAIARTALSHYIFRDNDPTAARRQMRAAAGLR
jgi:AcrR family transcriptional regulator